MLRRLERLAYRVASPLARTWWELRRAHHEGAKCVVAHGGEILLVRHTYGDRRRWDFPGGLAHRGEAPAATAVRELGEELGLALRPGELRALGVLSLRPGRRTDTVHYYVAAVSDRALDPDLGELAEVGWFAPGALPAPLGEHVGQVLEWDRAREGVSIVGNRSGESRPGLRGRRRADPQT